MEHARAMLIEHHLPKFLWPEAVAYAAYLKNRSPTRALKDCDVTPEEAFWNRKPDISTLQEFVRSAGYFSRMGKNQKLDPKSRPFIFTGLTDESRAYRYWKLGSRLIQTSRMLYFLSTILQIVLLMEMTLSPAPTQLEGEKREVKPPPDSDSTVAEIPEPKADTILMWYSHQNQPYQCGKGSRSSHVQNRQDLHQQISRITGNCITQQHARHSGNRSQMRKSLITLIMRYS